MHTLKPDSWTLAGLLLLSYKKVDIPQTEEKKFDLQLYVAFSAEK